MRRHGAGQVTRGCNWLACRQAPRERLADAKLDDRIELNARARMIAQLVAALTLVYVGGFRVESLGALGELGMTGASHLRQKLSRRFLVADRHDDAARDPLAILIPVADDGLHQLEGQS